MNNEIMKLLAKALIKAAEEYVAGTKNDLDDKALALLIGVLKHFKLV